MVTLLLPGMALVHCVPSDIASGLFGAEKYCEMLLREKTGQRLYLFNLTFLVNRSKQNFSFQEFEKCNTAKI